MTNKIKNKNAALMLEDGTVFLGKAIGAKGLFSGEICFNTSITGYQEILTDPSYHKQIICFTFPHIGNVGTNKDDYESNKPYANGLVMGAQVTEPSNYRSIESLDSWLTANNIGGITDVDTRALTIHIRDKGAQNCAIYTAGSIEEINFNELKQKLISTPSMKGMELAEEVSTKEPYKWSEGTWKQEENKFNDKVEDKYKVIAIDFGVKRNILRNLAEVGCAVEVVPAKSTADEIISKNPDGVFLSNGPGDPAETETYVGEVIKEIIESDIPVFGICLGHQILAKVLGCETVKMHQGHRGANQPVKNLETGKVEITSQNHGFVVSRDALPNGVKETHISLFDATNEGIEMIDKDVFSVQHHPEASPGPRDSEYIFKKFTDIMERRASMPKTEVRLA